MNTLLLCISFIIELLFSSFTGKSCLIFLYFFAWALLITRYFYLNAFFGGLGALLLLTLHGITTIEALILLCFLIIFVQIVQAVLHMNYYTIALVAWLLGTSVQGYLWFVHSIAFPLWINSLILGILMIIAFKGDTTYA